MESSTAIDPGRVPSRLLTPTRQEPSDLTLVRQSSMGQLDAERQRVIVSGLLSLGQPKFKVESLFGYDTASPRLPEVESSISSPPNHDELLLFEAISAARTAGQQYADKSSQLSLEPKDLPLGLTPSSSAFSENTSISPKFDELCSQNIQSFFGSPGIQTTSSQCSSFSLINETGSQHWIVDPADAEQQASPHQVLPVSTETFREQCAYEFDKIDEYPTQHVDISNCSSTFAAWLEQIPLDSNRSITYTPHEASRNIAGKDIASVCLTHQQLLVSQATDTYEYQFGQHSRENKQLQANASDQYQSLYLITTQPHETGSTKIPEIVHSQSETFRCSQDRPDLGIDSSMYNGTSLQEWFNGPIYDENGHALNETDSVRSQRWIQDRFLIESKLSGMSYKEIKSKGHFREAESTLRGRFRTLTKPKEHRVRKPFWHDQDLMLLREAVMEHKSQPMDAVPLKFKVSLDGGLEASKIPWKKVADYVARNGTYRFGNATCRKKWDEISRTSA